MGMSSLAAGMAIGVVGDAGVRANAQQPGAPLGGRRGGGGRRAGGGQRGVWGVGGKRGGARGGISQSKMGNGLGQNEARSRTEFFSPWFHLPGFYVEYLCWPTAICLLLRVPPLGG